MIKPIETIYKGYRFRSRLEARWAVFFDALGLQWEYEKEGFNVNGERYLPDFYLPEFNALVEIKGVEPTIKQKDLLFDICEQIECLGFIYIGMPNNNNCFWHNWKGQAVSIDVENMQYEDKNGFNMSAFDVVTQSRKNNLYDPYSPQWKNQLVCPVCQFEYVHFELPSKYSGWDGRGDCIRIPMNCENGHHWEMCLGFHKGYTCAFIDNIWFYDTDFFAYIGAKKGYQFCEMEQFFDKAKQARFEHGECG